MAATAAVAAGACGRAALTHLGGEPFSPVGSLVQIGDGWVAVDSCTAGVHALVEVEVPEDEPGYVLELLSGLQLALDSGEVHRASHIELAGPFCWPDTHDVEQPRLEGIPKGAPGGVACRGVYLVKAQFDLTRLPTDGERFLVIHGGKQTTVAWERR